MASLSDTSEAELALREGEYFHDRYVNLRERPDFERSREAYMRAFELDRNLADAPAGLAYLYGLAAEAGVMPLDEATENMEQWGQTAYEINPRNAMALTVLSQVQHMYPDPNLRTAVEYGLRAVRYDPQHWGGYAALAHGLMSYKLGSAVFAEASARDPLDLFSSTVVGLNAYFLGELDRGLELNDLTLEIDLDMILALWVRALILNDLGRLEEGRVTLDRVRLAVSNGRFGHLPLVLAEHAAALEANDGDAADNSFEAILAEIANPQALHHDLGYVSVITIPALAKHGRIEEAVTLATRLAEIDLLPVYDQAYLNPYFASLREDERFQAILARSSRRFQQQLQLLDRARDRGDLPAFLEEPFRALRELPVPAPAPAG